MTYLPQGSVHFFILILAKVCKLLHGLYLVVLHRRGGELWSAVKSCEELWSETNLFLSLYKNFVIAVWLLLIIIMKIWLLGWVSGTKKLAHLVVNLSSYCHQCLVHGGSYICHITVIYCTPCLQPKGNMRILYLHSWWVKCYIMM